MVKVHASFTNNHTGVMLKDLRWPELHKYQSERRVTVTSIIQAPACLPFSELPQPCWIKTHVAANTGLKTLLWMAMVAH